jgi:hypothetical protein
MNKKNDNIIDSSINTTDDDLDCYCNVCIITNNIGTFILKFIPKYKFFQNPYVFSLCFILIFLICITIIFSGLFNFLLFMSKIFA